MESANFRYQPLADAEDQIRLVSMLPETGQKRLHLKLETVSLHDIRNGYEAVSYMWGDPSRDRHAIVNEQRFQLRDNIWQCLKHLRDHDLTTSRLWVDSICIDQGNEREKSLQVARMSDIFACASRVLSWLGSTSMMQYPPSSMTGPTEESIATRPLTDLDSWLGSPGPSSSYLMDQAMSIVYNPYWTRLWIVPEVIQAQDLQIVFGNDLIDQARAGRIYLVARESSKPGYRSWFVKQWDPSLPGQKQQSWTLTL